jgi:hypothetical protein
VPAAAKVRRVLPTQVAAGGELHAVSVGGYEQVPPEHVPIEAKVRTCVPWHVGPGGVLHVTPAHGSAMQPPFTQPLGHVVSVGV